MYLRCTCDPSYKGITSRKSAPCTPCRARASCPPWSFVSSSHIHIPVHVAEEEKQDRMPSQRCSDDRCFIRRHVCQAHSRGVPPSRGQGSEWQGHSLLWTQWAGYHPDSDSLERSAGYRRVGKLEERVCRQRGEASTKDDNETVIHQAGVWEWEVRP